MEQTAHISDGRQHEPGSINIGDAQLGQLAYHIRWAAALAADGQRDSATQHALIAGAMLDVIGGDAMRSATEALDLPDVMSCVSQRAASQHTAAVELGYQFVSHFTSDGRHDLADLYLETTRRIGATV